MRAQQQSESEREREQRVKEALCLLQPSAFPLRLHTTRQEIKTGQKSLRVRGLLKLTQCYLTENTLTDHSTISKHAQKSLKMLHNSQLKRCGLETPTLSTPTLTRKSRSWNNPKQKQSRGMCGASVCMNNVCVFVQSVFQVQAPPALSFFFAIPTSRGRKVLC